MFTHQMQAAGRPLHVPAGRDPQQALGPVGGGPDSCPMQPKQGNGTMTDATIKTKARPAGSLGAAFENEIESARVDAPHFAQPKFELPKMEVPAAFREVAESGVLRAKESCEKLKAAAEEATGVIETTYATASR